MAKQAPTIGQWYEDITAYRFFEVVEIDESAGTIGIQFAEGDIDEIDFEIWSQIAVRLEQQPHYWQLTTDLGRPSYFNSDNVYVPCGARGLLEKIEPDSLFGWDDF